MSTSHDFQLGIFYPDQLDVLNRAVQKACRWHGLKEERLDADDLAGHALSLYSSGITDEDALFKRLRNEQDIFGTFPISFG